VALAALTVGLGSDRPAGAETPTELLREYLRLDTSNPPGGEAAAAALLAGVLHREGIATRLLVSPGGRTSLYARLEGGPAADGALVLLHHMDVVPPGLGWSVDPFAAEQRDGFVWGVGAIDDKSLGVAHLLAFVDLKRSAGSLAHDVVLLAVADEEAGGVEGAAWILERHPELVADARAVLTEGGSNRVFADRTQWWGIEVAQKRPLWLEISASGRSGHGSKLDLHSAPNKLVLALARLLEMPREYRVTAEARLYFDALDRLARVEGPGWIARVERAIEEGRVEALLPPGQHNLFLDTKQITLLDSGRLVNAIPGRARALVDVRALPDAETDALLGEIRETLGRDVAVEVLLDAPRVAPSSTDSPVWRCLERVLSAEAPVVPTFIAGVTDARHFRELGIPVYGVSPFALGAEDAQGVHGADERISRDAFERGVRTMTELLAACARP
jgi:acetylornithine deacetylase/succinyl-diaminopimelate desuccinylase-like protein